METAAQRGSSWEYEEHFQFKWASDGLIRDLFVCKSLKCGKHGGLESANIFEQDKSSLHFPCTSSRHHMARCISQWESIYNIFTNAQKMFLWGYCVILRLWCLFFYCREFVEFVRCTPPCRQHVGVVSDSACPSVWTQLSLAEEQSQLRQHIPPVSAPSGRQGPAATLVLFKMSALSATNGSSLEASNHIILLNAQAGVFISWG